MDQLYVKINSHPKDGFVQVPLKSLVTLFMLKYCEDTRVQLILVESSDEKKVSSEETLSETDRTELDSPSLDKASVEGGLSLSVNLSGLHYEIQQSTQLSPLAQSCLLPVILLADDATCVAGLCSVLRQVVKSSPVGYHSLLGFRSGCLAACAEVSLWTRFCEVDISQTVDTLLSEDFSETELVAIPEDVLRFEVHMNQPMRTHNILKKRRELAKARVGDREIVEHAFAEGPALTLADFILFPCFHVIFSLIGSQSLVSFIPLTVNWFNRLKEREELSELLSFINGVEKKVTDNVTYRAVKVPLHSLYKSDPKRYKPRNRIYTRQEDIDASLKMVAEVGLSDSVLGRPFGWEVSLDWASVPSAGLPENGNLPADRVDRKRQQLENLARAVKKIARPRDSVVDFCSGSGHLGLLLALLLPQCRVWLLENKHESLERARQRGRRLGLTNVVYLQTNLGYFAGAFDVGVALHACGVATDLVLQRCVARGAAFVCCPCCYGGVQATHALTYPRSVLLRRSALSLRDYLVLGHGADQTHGAGHFKTDQGNRCMAVIDGDRCQAARERGYHVTLAKLDPPTCSPKNNLLVGVPGLLKPT